MSLRLVKSTCADAKTNSGNRNYPKVRGFYANWTVHQVNAAQQGFGILLTACGGRFNECLGSLTYSSGGSPALSLQGLLSQQQPTTSIANWPQQAIKLLSIPEIINRFVFSGGLASISRSADRRRQMFLVSPISASLMINVAEGENSEDGK